MSKKITELPAASTVETTDVLAFVDLTGPTTQKVTVAAIGDTNHPGLSPAFLALSPLKALTVNAAGTAITASLITDLPLPVADLDPAGGNNGDVITRVAGVPTWANPATGSNPQVMFNLSGTLAGRAGFEYDTASNQLTAPNLSASFVKVATSGQAGTDVVGYFSGSYGLTGSNPERKAFVLLCDYMLSGTFQQQRPSQSPNLHRWNIFTQSITTGSNPTVVFSWPIVSGSTCVDAQFIAVRANVTQAGVFAQKALFRNNNNTVVCVGTGSISAGSIVDTGLAWSAQITGSSGTGQLVVTGSASTTITWSIDATFTEVTP